jgi:hypothetical protein
MVIGNDSPRRSGGKKIENREPHVINRENVGKAGMRIQSTTVSLEQPRHREKGKKRKTDRTQNKVMGKESRKR